MISIIIPNYNGEELLRKNLPRLISSLKNYDYEVIVVDDGSVDNSVRVIEDFAKKNERIKFLKNEKNLGFSPSINKGVNGSKGNYIVLLNNDVYPESDFLKAALSDLKDEEVFAVGFKDLSVENGNKVPRGRGVAKWMRGFFIHRAGDLNKKDNMWASGGSSAFNRKIWEEIGGLDEIYAPFYWEDIDISYRARKAGYKVLFEKNSEVVHEHEEGAIRRKYTKEQVRAISFRNQFIFVWINGSRKSLLLNIVWLPYHVFKSLITFDLSFMIGLLSFIVKLPKVLSRRNKVQKLFKISDKEATISE